MVAIGKVEDKLAFLPRPKIGRLSFADHPTMSREFCLLYLFSSPSVTVIGGECRFSTVGGVSCAVSRVDLQTRGGRIRQTDLHKHLAPWRILGRAVEMSTLKLLLQITSFGVRPGAQRMDQQRSEGKEFSKSSTGAHLRPHRHRARLPLCCMAHLCSSQAVKCQCQLEVCHLALCTLCASHTCMCRSCQLLV